MPIDVKELTGEQLQNLVDNHRKQNATGAPLYLAALSERQRRKGKGLDFEKSFQIIRAAAKERRFLSYKELADASGAEWSQVHYLDWCASLGTCGVRRPQRLADA